MKNNLTQDEIRTLYWFTANGDNGAFEFLSHWSVYCHRFDDLVDVDFNALELIETNNELLRLTTCKFFRANAEILLPQIYLAAEAYRASEGEEKGTALGIHLSHEGNNMLRVVALITGGFNHLVEVSKKVRGLTYVEHPLDEGNGDNNVPIKFDNLPIKD